MAPLVTLLADGELGAARARAAELAPGDPHRLLVEVDTDSRELRRSLTDLHAALQRPDVAEVGTPPWLWAQAVLAVTPVVIRAVLDVIATNADPATVEELDRHIDTLAAANLRHARLWYVQAAHVLADLASPHARTFAARAAALAAVDGNLCEHQFPYEELFVAERHRFVAEWEAHARLALATGEAGPADLAGAAAALGVDLGHLAR